MITTIKNRQTKIYITFVVVLAIIYNINIIRPTVIVDLFTKQDKSQEINSQGNSGTVNNIKYNSGGVHNQNTMISIPIRLAFHFGKNIYNDFESNIPIRLAFHFGKNIYNDFESNACVALEIIHSSNNVLYDFAKTNPHTYEFLENLNSEFFLRDFCITHNYPP